MSARHTLEIATVALSVVALAFSAYTFYAQMKQSKIIHDENVELTLQLAEQSNALNMEISQKNLTLSKVVSEQALDQTLKLSKFEVYSEFLDNYADPTKVDKMSHDKWYLFVNIPTKVALLGDDVLSERLMCMYNSLSKESSSNGGDCPEKKNRRKCTKRQSLDNHSGTERPEFNTHVRTIKAMMKQSMQTPYGATPMYKQDWLDKSSCALGVF